MCRNRRRLAENEGLGIEGCSEGCDLGAKGLALSAVLGTKFSAWHSVLCGTQFSVALGSLLGTQFSAWCSVLCLVLNSLLGTQFSAWRNSPTSCRPPSLASWLVHGVNAEELVCTASNCCLCAENGSNLSALDNGILARDKGSGCWGLGHGEHSP